MAKNEGFLPVLLYYKGEAANPFSKKDIRSAYWDLEQVWLNQVVDDKILDREYTTNFMIDFEPNFLNDINSVVPLSLKAFLYDRYYYCGGTKEGFVVWFRNYTQVTLHKQQAKKHK